jgi:alpha-ketoglutarate-dependent taurine dioxygenase
VTNTNFTVEPLLNKSFGARLTNLTLDKLDEESFAQIYACWLEFGLLVFPGQHLTNEQQVTFARRFGELEFDLAPISNIRKDGSVRPENDDVVKVLKGNMGWHADSTYMPIQAKGAVFTAHIVPPDGGETGWADMRAAYDCLNADMKEKLQGLSAYHSLHYSQMKLGHDPKKDKGGYSGYGFHDQEPPLRPLVKTHPETGRKSLLIGRHAYGIPGLSESESEALLDELMAHACQAPRIYHHSWIPGDAVIWDNRCLLHQACPWDLSIPRLMFHARIAGDKASEFAASN